MGKEFIPSFFFRTWIGAQQTFEKTRNCFHFDDYYDGCGNGDLVRLLGEKGHSDNIAEKRIIK